jgi:hypothetical protein
MSISRPTGLAELEGGQAVPIRKRGFGVKTKSVRETGSRTPRVAQCQPAIERTKSPQEDPSAPALVEAILNSDGYRLADEDMGYLKSSDTRGMRLQLDDLKVETLLEQHRIRGGVWNACPASTL